MVIIIFAALDMLSLFTITQTTPMTILIGIIIKLEIISINAVMLLPHFYCVMDRQLTKIVNI